MPNIAYTVRDASICPARTVILRAIEAIKQNPLALLCERTDCERCAAVREGLRG